MTKKKDKVERWIVATDTHYPLHDRKANSCMLQAIEKVKPDGFIHLGDLGEWESFSHWQWKRKKKPPLEYQIPIINKEVATVNQYCAELDKVLDKAKVKKRVQIAGNHELWIDQFVEEYPYMKDYKFEKLVMLKERGFDYVPNHEMYKIGKLNLYHGNLYSGEHHAKSHLSKMGVNIMYGDKHSIQQFSISHVDGEKSAWCIGCIKSLLHKDNQFMGGRPCNWGHAFAIVDKFDGGLFSVHVVRIINGKCSLWGKVIYGK